MPTCPPFPPLSCDCHVHVFNDEYPTVANAVLRPPPASVPEYLSFAQRAGTRRVVLVQPSCYGTDNRLLLKALAELGTSARAVAVVNDTASDAYLASLHEAGVRGLRFNQVQVGATRMEMVRSLADRVAQKGWHIQLHMKASELPQHEALLASLPTPLVLDHGGRVPLDADDNDPAWTTVRRLVDRGTTWVKLSGPYIESVADAPEYRRAALLGKELVRRAPERILWGSDWPHATEISKPSLDGLLHYFWQCAGDDQTARQILVDNPSAIYGFDFPPESGAQRESHHRSFPG